MGLGVLSLFIVYCFIAMLQGILWGLEINPIIPIPTILIAIPLAVYTSILPDVDIRTSLAYAVSIIVLVAFVWILVLFAVLTAIMGLLTLSVLVIALLLPHHRGFFHSLGFVSLFSIGMMLLFWDWRLGLVAFACTISHLVGDK